MASPRNRGVEERPTEPPRLERRLQFPEARAHLALLDPHRALDFHREARTARRKTVRAGHADLAFLEKPAERENRAQIAIALGQFQRAHDEYDKARAEWKVLGKDDDADRVVARMLVLSLRELGDLSDAGRILGHARRLDMPARGEEALALRLLKAEYDLGLGREREARTYVDELFEATSRGTPPRFRVQVALAGLSLTGKSNTPPERQIVYMQALVNALHKPRPDPRGSICSPI